MATFAKNWTHDVNNFIGPQATVAEQYALAFLAFHESLKAAGYTVVWSSNGTVADATDNVATTADVVQGDNTSSPRTWILYAPPVGLPDAGSWQLLVEPETVTGVSKNQGVDTYADILGFDTSGASVSSTPTPNGPQASASLQVDFELRPWNNGEEWQGMWWHAMWTDEGDFIWFTREERYSATDPHPQGIFVIRTDTSARAGTPAGHLQLVMEWSSASTPPVIPSVPDSVAVLEDGANNLTSGVAVGGYTTLAQITPDVEQGQRVVHLPCYLSGNADARWLGVWTDIRLCNPNYAYGLVEADDADSLRYAHIIKGLMIPWPADELPTG